MTTKVISFSECVAIGPLISSAVYWLTWWMCEVQNAAFSGVIIAFYLLEKLRIIFLRFLKFPFAHIHRLISLDVGCFAANHGKLVR